MPFAPEKRAWLESIVKDPTAVAQFEKDTDALKDTMRGLGIETKEFDNAATGGNAADSGLVVSHLAAMTKAMGDLAVASSGTKETVDKLSARVEEVAAIAQAAKEISEKRLETAVAEAIAPRRLAEAGAYRASESSTNVDRGAAAAANTRVAVNGARGFQGMVALATKSAGIPNMMGFQTQPQHQLVGEEMPNVNDATAAGVAALAKGGN